MTVAGWYPDPGGQFEYRYWDGTIWTDSVSTGGGTYTQPLPNQTQPTQTAQPMTAADAQAQGFGEMFPSQPPPTAHAAAPSHMLTAPTVMLMQTGKLLEFAFYDGHHTIIGQGTKDGSTSRLSPTINVVDQHGKHVVRVEWSRTALLVDAPEGRIGAINFTNAMNLRTFTFDFLHANQLIAKMEGPSSLRGNQNIMDLAGNVLGYVAKVPIEGQPMRQRLTGNYDCYALVVPQPIDPTLRALATFAPMLVDYVRGS